MYVRIMWTSYSSLPRKVCIFYVSVSLYTCNDHLMHVQEAGLMEVEKEMSVENYDIDAVKSLLNEILDKFISDLGYGDCIGLTYIIIHTCAYTCTNKCKNTYVHICKHRPIGSKERPLVACSSIMCVRSTHLLGGGGLGACPPRNTLNFQLFSAGY